MSTWPLWLDLAIALLLLIGVSFALIGSVALVRWPTFIQRLHGPTKASTLGLCGIVLALALLRLQSGTLPLRELLLLGFLFWSAPLAAQQLAQAWLRRPENDVPDRDSTPGS